MEVECLRFRIKDGALPKLREWSNTLKSQIGEVKSILKKEGIFLESAFLEKTTDGYYLIYFIRASNLKKSKKISDSSEHPIDLYHQKIMGEIIDTKSRLECLLDVEVK